MADMSIKKMRQILKQFPLWSMAIKNLDDDAATYKGMLASVGARAVDASRIPAGSFSGASPTEAAAAEREHICEKVAAIERQRAALYLKVRKVNRSIDALGDMEGKVIRARYIEGKSWVAISLGLYISEKLAREIEQSGMKKLAAMLLYE